jgi:hypothetical protein
VLISRIFNHVPHCGNAASDSSADFFRREPVATIGYSGQRREPWSLAMTFFGPFAGRLSVVTAYVAIAFVGAIILGVF